MTTAVTPDIKRSERQLEIDVVYMPGNRYAGLITVAAAICLFAALVLGLESAPPSEVEMAGFATSLAERTESQQFNARKAAVAINNTVLQPGGEFSFNRTVRSWSLDRGYVKAPVSYDGELIRAYGGGVCQTSTTLYNAALLAGLTILERHPHEFAPHYVPPGRDAAVAQYDVDLRFRNPYNYPIRIVLDSSGDRLEARVMGARKPASAIAIETERLATVAPRRLTRLASNDPIRAKRRYLRNPGAFGRRVVSYRCYSHNGSTVRREMLGDDSYQAMNRVVQVSDD